MGERIEKVKSWLIEYKKQAACVSAVAVLVIAAVIGTTVIYGKQTEDKLNIEADNKANTSYKTTAAKKSGTKTDSADTKKEIKQEDVKGADIKKSAETSKEKSEQKSVDANKAREASVKPSTSTGEVEPESDPGVAPEPVSTPASEPTYTPAIPEPAPSPVPEPTPEPSYTEEPSAPSGGGIEVDSNYYGANDVGGYDYGGGGTLTEDEYNALFGGQ